VILSSPTWLYQIRAFVTPQRTTRIRMGLRIVMLDRRLALDVLDVGAYMSRIPSRGGGDGDRSTWSGQPGGTVWTVNEHVITLGYRWWGQEVLDGRWCGCLSSGSA
jgi:hypothetical protein